MMYALIVIACLGAEGVCRAIPIPGPTEGQTLSQCRALGQSVTADRPGWSFVCRPRSTHRERSA